MNAREGGRCTAVVEFETPQLNCQLRRSSEWAIPALVRASEWHQGELENHHRRPQDGERGGIAEVQMSVHPLRKGK